MSSAATRYQSRAPRYVLNANDHMFMRFAGMETRGSSAQAAMINLSETGLLFAIPASADFQAPDEGDMLKIEFTIPGGKQIACFATVVRVEQESRWSPEHGERHYQVVALKFRHLPAPHYQALHAGLLGKTTPEETHVRAHVPTFEVVIFVGLTLTLFLNFYLLSQPVATWVKTFRQLF